MSLKEFKTELAGLGAKISASRIQKLTHLAIKLSLKCADQIVATLAEYIQESSFSTRLGAISVIDSICRGAAKLHEKDSKWENVYYKLIPEIVGPVVNVLFDCSSKDREKMKRIVGLWKETPKLLPVEFADEVYTNNFVKDRSDSKPEVETSIEAASPARRPSQTESPAAVKSATNSPARSNLNNSNLSQNLSPVDPSAIAGLSALLNLPSFAGLSLPIMTTATVNGTLGLTGLATENATSSILAGLGALGGQSISIGLPGATPANIASLMGSTNSQSNSRSSDPRGGGRNDTTDAYSHHPDRRQQQYDSPHTQSNQFGNSGNSFGMDPRQQNSYSSDPRQQQQQGYGNDPRQQQSTQGNGNDPRQHNATQGYANDPRQQSSFDPRQQPSSYGGDPRNHQQGYGNTQQYGNNDSRQQSHQQYGADPRQNSFSPDPRQQQLPHSYNRDEPRGANNHQDSRDSHHQRDSNRDVQSSRYPSTSHEQGDRSFQPKRAMNQPPLAPGPDCLPAFLDPTVSKDFIKIISRTLFISGLTPSINQAVLKEMLEKEGRTESVRITQKMQAFVKAATRKEAEGIKHAFQGFRIDPSGPPLKIGWGCGYGPKDGFDFQEGTTMYEISRIPEQDIPYIEGSPRGGGSVVGGMAMEEPNVPLELTLAGRGGGGGGGGVKRPMSGQTSDFPPRQRWN